MFKWVLMGSIRQLWQGVDINQTDINREKKKILKIKHAFARYNFKITMQIRGKIKPEFLISINFRFFEFFFSFSKCALIYSKMSFGKGPSHRQRA